MPLVHYKISAWGNPVGNGATAPNFVAVAGVAKRAQPASPYIVANEVICGALGRGLCLPVPPGFVVDREGVPQHVSLDFNLAGEGLPPADPVALIAAHPKLAAGIVLFDSWIVNTDRHPGNLAFFPANLQVNIFDHSHAFLGSGTDGRAHLEAHRGQLGIAGHCLASLLTEPSHFDEWLTRLAGIPTYWIEQALWDATSVGMEEDLVPFCLQFLEERRANMRQILRASSGAFPAIPLSLWDHW